MDEKEQEYPYKGVYEDIEKQSPGSLQLLRIFLHQKC